MIHKQHNGVQWLEFELLANAPIAHGCFLRHGGSSSGRLESLNLGRRVGDQPQHVQDNVKKVSAALSHKLSTTIEEILCARICHGADVYEINASSPQELPISDSLMTQQLHRAIAITQADCQAAIFYDPIHHSIANVHCGWRGNVSNVYQATIEAMRATYGTNPADLLVGISPSLGPEHAEFLNYQNELPQAFWEFQIRPNHFDLWAISRRQLEQAGVLPQHIQIAQIDTYDSRDYFSHRHATHHKMLPCGRQATVCALT